MLHGALRPLGGARGGAGGGGGAPGPPPCPLPAALRARPGPAAPSVRRGCRPGCHGGGAGPPPGPTAGAAGGRWAAAGCRRLLQLEGQVGAGQVGAGQVGARGPGVRLRAPPFASGPGRGGSSGSGPGPGPGPVWREATASLGSAPPEGSAPAFPQEDAWRSPHRGDSAWCGRCLSARAAAGARWGF